MPQNSLPLSNLLQRLLGKRTVSRTFRRFAKVVGHSNLGTSAEVFEDRTLLSFSNLIPASEIQGDLDIFVGNFLNQAANESLDDILILGTNNRLAVKNGGFTAFDTSRTNVINTDHIRRDGTEILVGNFFDDPNTSLDDGVDDIFIRDNDGNSRLIVADGNGGFDSSRVSVINPIHLRSLADTRLVVGDFLDDGSRSDDDGIDDIFIYDGNGNTRLAVANGDGTFNSDREALVDNRHLSFNNELFAGNFFDDANTSLDDGLDDIFIRDPNGNSRLAVALGGTNGNFNSERTDLIPSAFILAGTQIVVGNFVDLAPSDQFDDLFSFDVATGQNRIAIGTGRGGFESITSLVPPSQLAGSGVEVVKGNLGDTITQVGFDELFIRDQSGNNVIIEVEVFDGQTVVVNIFPTSQTTEGDSGQTIATFNVTLERPIDRDVTFNFSTVPKSALPNVDFLPVNGAGRIPSGQTVTTIDVPIFGDGEVELDEIFSIEISNLQAGGLPVEFDPTTEIRPGRGIAELGVSDTFDVAKAVVVVNDTAFVADSYSGGLRVLDVSDPANIRELGAVGTPGGANDLRIVDGLAFIADREEGLRVLNIENPSNISVEGFFPTNGDSHAVDVVNNLAFVADGPNGLHILDVGVPSTISPIKNVDTPGNAVDVHVVNGLAYVADGESGLRVVDVTDPANAIEIGFFETDEAFSVQVTGSLAFVADRGRGLRVLDVSNPANITEVGNFDTPGEARGITVVGNLAYVSDYTGGLRVLDVSDPARMTEIAVFASPGLPLSVQVVGNLAYVADDLKGLRVLEVGNPASITEAGYFESSGQAFKVQVVNNRAYVASQTDGLRVLNISDPSDITQVGSFDTPGSAQDVQIVGDIAYVADGGSGLRVLNISNPANINDLGSFDTPNDAVSLEVIDNRAYVADRSGGLRILDVTDPADIDEIGFINIPGDFKGVTVVRDLAYIADHTGNFRIFDVRNPAVFNPKDSIETPGSPNSVQVIGDLAYIADDSTGLQIFDVSNPEDISMAGMFDTPGTAIDVQVVGNLAYIADGVNGLLVLDVSDRDNIVQVGAFDTPSNAFGLDIVGNQAYVADRESGLRVLNLGQSAKVEATISNDDFVSLNISDVVMVEGNGTSASFRFDVTLDQEISENLTFDFMTVADTATASDDFIAVNSFGTIPAGQKSTTIEVSVIGESIVESEEQFFVDLSNFQAGGLSVQPVTTRATGTIQNDDSATVILASVENIATQQLEGDTPATRAEFQFSVTLDNPVAGGFAVEYFVRNGAFDPQFNPGVARLGQDFSLDDSAIENVFNPVTGVGTLTFSGAANERLFLDLSAIADEVVEADEFFHIELGDITVSNPAVDPNDVTVSDVRPGDRRQQGVILNRLNNTPDDVSNLSIAFNEFFAGENGEQMARLTITSSNAVEDGFTVTLFSDTGSANPLLAPIQQPLPGGSAKFAGERNEPQTVVVMLPEATSLAELRIVLGGVTPLQIGVRPEDIIPGTPLVLTTQEDQVLVAGAGPGGTPHVQVLVNNTVVMNLFPYPGFTGGVRVTTGDVSGDGTPDIITAPGPGGGPIVLVFDGKTGNQLHELAAYPGEFVFGLSLAAADFNNDGRAEIVTAPDFGGGSHVRVFDLTKPTLAEQVMSEFFSHVDYSQAPPVVFTGGIRFALGNVIGDATPEIITVPATNGGPIVQLYDGRTGAFLRQFAAYNVNFSAGLFVTTGDFNNDGIAEIVTGPNAGGGPVVRIFDAVQAFINFTPENTGLLREFGAYPGDFLAGVRVGVMDFDRNGTLEIVTVPGQGNPGVVRFFEPFPSNPEDSGFLAQIEPFGEFGGGVFLGTSSPNGVGAGQLTVASFSGTTPNQNGQETETQDDETYQVSPVDPVIPIYESIESSLWDGLEEVDTDVIPSPKIESEEKTVLDAVFAEKTILELTA